MRRAEVRWYKLKSPDKRRPVLVLHRTDVIEHLAELTIAPITSRVRDIPSEVPLSPTEDGVPRDCAVNLDHIQTVPKARLGTLIATLSERRMEEVAHALRFALAL